MPKKGAVCRDDRTGPEADRASVSMTEWKVGDAATCPRDKKHSAQGRTLGLFHEKLQYVFS